MSHCVIRWQAKVAALGLLMCLVLLSGSTCMNELLPGVGLDSGTKPPAAQNALPTITVSSPLSDMTITAGTVVQISWTLFDPTQQAKITVFFDTDKVASNGFTTLTIINNSNLGAPVFYNWDTTGLAAGTYYVGAQVDDGTNPPATSYAAGRVIVSSSVTTKECDLGDLGNTVKGCIFEGMSFVGRLGDVMAGRFDMLSVSGPPDGVSDFVLVAPQADSHYEEDPGVGEAYVIFGWDGQTTSRSDGWYKGGRFNVNQVGSDPDVPGFIVVGPAYITKSLGITSVQPLADLDGDRGSELMFGTPLLINGRYDSQDYDPESRIGYANAPFAYPTGPTPWNPDWHDWYGGRVWSSGYITVLASSTPGLYRGVTPTAPGLGGVIHIDEIGADPGDPVRRDLHPRSIRYLQSGVRVYPYAHLERWYDFLNNDYRFGQELGTEDVDGDGVPDWLISAPQNANDAGQIDIGFSEFAWLWNRTLPQTASSYSWPYMIQGPGGVDRIPIWPFALIDRIRGDELKAPHGHLGNPTGVGDFNGDKLGDVASSTPTWSGEGLPEAGAAYLVFGRAPFGDHAVSEIKDPVVLNALPGIAIFGTAAGDHVGQKMTALGRPNYGMVGHPKLRDFNGDGLPDWVISAPGRARTITDADGNVIEVRAQAGAIAIVWGNSRLDGQFTWDQIGTPDVPGIIITGTNQGDEFGTYIAEAGDLNGDGSDDLLVAAPGAENPITGVQDAGAVYVIYGPPAAGTNVAAYQKLSGTYDINDLLQNGPVKVRAYYGAAAGHRIGPVAGAGDINNDGYEDFLIADPVASPLGRTSAGEVYLIFGGKY